MFFLLQWELRLKISTSIPSLDFRPVGHIIRHELNEEQRERLTEHIVNSVRQIHPTDLIAILPLIMAETSLQMAVLKTVTTFITNEMQLHVTQGWASMADILLSIFCKVIHYVQRLALRKWYTIILDMILFKLYDNFLFRNFWNQNINVLDLKIRKPESLHSSLFCSYA